MICTIDANALILWASPKTDDLTLARLNLLLDAVTKAKGAIIIPTPAVSELLIRTDEGTAAWLQGLQKRNAVRVASFDLRAATECALIHRLAEKAGGKRSGARASDAYQKIKVDRQIAAIAKARRPAVNECPHLTANPKPIARRRCRRLGRELRQPHDHVAGVAQATVVHFGDVGKRK